MGEEAACAVTEPLSGKANAEVYDLVEKTYSNASFSKFDFATVKRALIDDVRLNFSEVFNTGKS